MLDFKTCETARQERDPKFDGLFFTAMKTTGIYCRNVCPVKQPLTKNVTYYQSAPAAEHAGFRPCLRCRPETAPFCPAWNGTKTTVERALKLIEAGALDQGNVEQLSDRVGVGARHLSRLFSKHIGASPTQTAKTFRLQKAKRMLDNSDLSITEIAYQAGFGSLRRFNAAFHDLYDRPPTQIRRQAKEVTQDEQS